MRKRGSTKSATFPQNATIIQIGKTRTTMRLRSETGLPIEFCTPEKAI